MTEALRALPPEQEVPGVPTTVDPADVARFSAIAAEWWDPKGKFAPLHRFNPVRLAAIRDRALSHFGRDGTDRAPFTGLTLLDMGCGGGLISEPMARMGFSVTGIDASEKNIQTARVHAAEQGLGINYQPGTAEALAAAGARFDIVLALEIVEHVADRELFLASCAAMVRPGGLMVLATLNRTAKAYALAIVGAEYVLGWLPRGTHDWQQFVKPSELAAPLRQAGLTIDAITGLSFNPLSGRWSEGRDTAVNYMLWSHRPA